MYAMDGRGRVAIGAKNFSLISATRSKALVENVVCLHMQDGTASQTAEERTVTEKTAAQPTSDQRYRPILHMG